MLAHSSRVSVELSYVPLNFEGIILQNRDTYWFFKIPGRLMILLNADTHFTFDGELIVAFTSYCWILGLIAEGMSHKLG